MSSKRKPSAEQVRSALVPVALWYEDDRVDEPEQSVLAHAVRVSAEYFASQVPGKSVELRIVPFIAVQVVAGSNHRRGTPPNVIEMGARAWLLLFTGKKTFEDLIQDRQIEASGAHCRDIVGYFPCLQPDTMTEQ